MSNLPLIHGMENMSQMKVRHLEATKNGEGKRFVILKCPPALMPRTRLTSFLHISAFRARGS